MYEKIIALMQEKGDELPVLAGAISDIGIKKKWLTEKDIEIEQAIQDLVSSFGPNHMVFAEELNDSYKEAEELWIIDPISSTRNLISGIHHYTVVVAHMHKGVLQFGAVYDPAVKEMFTAYKGKGAFLNGKKISVSDRSEDFNILYSPWVHDPFTKERNINVFSQLLDLGMLYNIGSFGLHYAYVACGRFDCFITQNKDCFPEFAGKIILEEAGGVMTDFTGGELTKDPKGIIATRKELLPKLLEIVNS